jgi:membrane dipeptidase
VDLRAGGAALVCGTIFCEPASGSAPKGYRTAQEAREMAQGQLRWYRQQAQRGAIRLVTSAGQLARMESPTGNRPWPIPIIVLVEGADPIAGVEDAKGWFDGGVRVVGLAWGRTRYAGGTGAPGPLTAEGIELVRALNELGIVHDVSHLAEESFWQLLDISDAPAMASHSNCRGLIPTDRQLSDEMIRAIAERGGVIGINFYDKFLVPPGEYGKRRARLSDVVGQIRRVCQVTGDTCHVGIGSDMGGGFAGEHLPEEVRTWADLPRLADALRQEEFSSQDIGRIMGRNWIRFFGASLPR